MAAAQPVVRAEAQAARAGLAAEAVVPEVPEVDLVLQWMPAIYGVLRGRVAAALAQVEVVGEVLVAARVEGEEVSELEVARVRVAAREVSGVVAVDFPDLVVAHRGALAPKEQPRGNG